jgi:hypothetical protein
MKFMGNAPAAALVPTGQIFDGVFEAIQEACRAVFGVDCQRGDVTIAHPGRREHLGKLIEQASLVVADITGEEPGVYYGVGRAEALKKPVILISRRSGIFEADPGRLAVLIYGGDLAFLRDHLTALLAAGGKRESGSPAARFEMLFGEILARHGFQHHGGIRLEDETTFVLEEQEMPLALVQELARKAREAGVRLKLL